MGAHIYVYATQHADLVNLLYFLTKSTQAELTQIIA
jgi:hypothetical protein